MVDSSLSLSLRSLIVANSSNGTTSPPLDNSGLSMTIDSAYPDLWLPPSACDSLAEALNLTLDSATGRYLIDSATRNSLLSNNPEFTFTMAANQTSEDTINIVLPYSAFERQLLPPIYQSPVPYSPIRPAPEGSSFILGRTFLQEAYLVVDWERGNFTLGQAQTDDSPPSIVPILPPNESSSAGGGSLGAGAIAGIVIGAVAVALGIAAFFWYRGKSKAKEAQKNILQTSADEKDGTVLAPGNKKREQWPEGEEKPVELYAEENGNKEKRSTNLPELHEETATQQLMSELVFEHDSGYKPNELESSAR